MIEDSIAGRAAVTHDDTANYTLSTANSATDEARNAILNVAGALGAARNTVCPTSSKVYIYKNATTGGYATTLKTSGGTGIAVPNGKTTLLFCDGTNVVMGIDWLNNLTLGGTLTVDSTSTMTGQVTFSAAASAIFGTTHKWYAFNDATYAFLTNEASGAGEGIRVSATEVALMANGSVVLNSSTTEVSTPNKMRIANAFAIPAGGTDGQGYSFSSTANFGIYFGSGAPTLSASQGSLYLSSNGSGVSNRLYVNTNGTTGWTAITTAS